MRTLLQSQPGEISTWLTTKQMGWSLSPEPHQEKGAMLTAANMHVAKKSMSTFDARVEGGSSAAMGII